MFRDFKSAIVWLSALVYLSDSGFCIKKKRGKKSGMGTDACYMDDIVTYESSEVFHRERYKNYSF